MKIVGTYLSESKYQDLNWKIVEETGAARNIKFIRLDLDTPLPETDLVLTKFNPDLAKSQTDVNACNRLLRFEEYIADHPSLRQLDPLSCQRQLLSRKRVSEAIQIAEESLQEGREQIHSPSYRIAQKEEDYTSLIAGLRFPLIVKTVDAGGSSTSHVMAVVFDEPGIYLTLTTGIHCLKPPLLIQEYINHNSTLFKCFVLGDYAEVDIRPSVRNFFPDVDRKPLIFDSQQPFPGPGSIC